MATTLNIKGIRQGLLITVPPGRWAEVRPSLLKSIDDQPDFFRGAQIALQVGDRVLGAAELGELRDDLAQREITLWAVLSSAPGTQRASADLGLATQLERQAPRREEEELPFDSEVHGEEAVLVRRTLRSGHRVRHPGHVVVLGDVNPGAEIIAGGNVIVWGRLRGVVHAGATGDEAAVVCALNMAPTQLRIAGHIAVSPERKGRAAPEMVHLMEGQLVAETWQDGKRRRG